jgi:hypothetical protein
LLLEQFVTSELERALEEVSSSGWAKSGQKRSSTLICDNLSDSAEKSSVICDRIELDSCLNTVIGLSVH